MHPKNTQEIIEKARVFVREKPSQSYIQRRLLIGYNQAMDLMELFERDGPVSKRKQRRHPHVD